MKIITKEPYIRVYDCKLVDFTHGEPEHETEVQIVMWDDTIDMKN